MAHISPHFAAAFAADLPYTTTVFECAYTYTCNVTVLYHIIFTHNVVCKNRGRPLQTWPSRYRTIMMYDRSFPGAGAENTFWIDASPATTTRTTESAHKSCPGHTNTHTHPHTHRLAQTSCRRSFVRMPQVGGGGIISAVVISVVMASHVWSRSLHWRRRCPVIFFVFIFSFFTPFTTRHCKYTALCVSCVHNIVICIYSCTRTHRICPRPGGRVGGTSMWNGGKKKIKTVRQRQSNRRGSTISSPAPWLQGQTAHELSRTRIILYCYMCIRVATGLWYSGASARAPSIPSPDIRFGHCVWRFVNIVS